MREKHKNLIESTATLKENFDSLTAKTLDEQEEFRTVRMRLEMLENDNFALKNNAETYKL